MALYMIDPENFPYDDAKEIPESWTKVLECRSLSSENASWFEYYRDEDENLWGHFSLDAVTEDTGFVEWEGELFFTPAKGLCRKYTLPSDVYVGVVDREIIALCVPRHIDSPDTQEKVEFVDSVLTYLLTIPEGYVDRNGIKVVYAHPDVLNIDDARRKAYKFFMQREDLLDTISEVHTITLPLGEDGSIEALHDFILDILRGKTDEED